MKRFWYLRWLAIAFGTMTLMVVAAGIVAAIYVARVSQDLPNYKVLANYRPPMTTRIHAGDGTLIAEFAKQKRLFVPIDEIPVTVRDAFVAAEDANFYEHGGISPRGILRAAIADVGNYIHHRRPEGGSTITQQVAKNFLLSSDVKLERKVKEALIAQKIEKHFTKDQILELYLNQIYLGMSAYGVASAALQYFDKSLDELTLSEAAFLAALPKAPNNYNPITEHARAIARRNYVLGRMEDKGYITHAQMEQAESQDLVVHPRNLNSRYPEAEYFTEEVRRKVQKMYGNKALYEGGLSVRTTLDTDYQRVAQRVLRKGLEAYDHTRGWRGPVTHLDLQGAPNWQQTLAKVKAVPDLSDWTLAVVLSVADDRAEIGLQTGGHGHIPLDDVKWARSVDKKGHRGPAVTKVSQVLARGDVVYVQPVLKEGVRETNKSKTPDPDQIDYWSLRQIPQVNGAIVAMDPHTGRVLALSGGFSFDLSEFDRAVQADRQPGSSFKPFVYAAALDVDGGKRFTPSSLVLDAPFVLDQGAGLGYWKPENYEEEFTYGPATLRRAIEKSLNLVTIRLAQEIGMDRIVNYAYRMGEITKIPKFKPLSMAIGALETTLLHETTAYCTFVNGGKKVEATLIDRIQNRYGKTIYKHDKRKCTACNAPEWTGQAPPVLPDDRPQVLDPRTAFQIVNMMTGVVQRGTGYVVHTVGKPLAGKTGTTNDERDAWFVGFSPDLAVGVYVGYDTPRSLGRRGTGGLVAAPVFRDFMQAVIGDKPAIPFRIPPGITMVRVRPSDGQPAGPGERSILEAFKTGTEPTGQTQPVLNGEPLTMQDLQQPDTSISGVVDPSNTHIGAGTGGLY
jgi:penicillin-binding protein 1A